MKNANLDKEARICSRIRKNAGWTPFARILANAATNKFSRLASAVILLATAFPSFAGGQPDFDPFWDDDRRSQAAAAAQLVLERNPYTQAVLRIRGRNPGVWHENPLFDVNLGAPPLDPDWLAKIDDKRNLPNLGRFIGEEQESQDRAVYKAYCQAVRFAARVPIEAFIKSADENKYVTWGHLYQKSADYRGKVIPLQGRLLRVRQLDAPLALQAEDIKFVYEGWILGPTKNSYPFVVIFPNLPKDKTSPTGVLEPAEDLNRKVTFFGYHFKKYRYPVQIGFGANVRTEEHTTALLIGPAPILADSADSVTGTVWSMSIKLLFVFGAGVLVLLFFLHWWFRRGDRSFRAQLDRLRAAQAMEALEKENQYSPHVPREDGRADASGASDDVS